jgi:hypothetical protein
MRPRVRRLLLLLPYGMRDPIVLLVHLISTVTILGQALRISAHPILTDIVQDLFDGSGWPLERQGFHVVDSDIGDLLFPLTEQLGFCSRRSGSISVSPRRP